MVPADINGDGAREVLCLAGYTIAVVAESGRAVASLSTGQGPCSSGVGSWTLRVARVGGRPALIVADSLSRVIRAQWVDGAGLWQYTYPGTYLTPPEVADVDGDGNDEIMVTGHGGQGLLCLDGTTGRPRWTFGAAPLSCGFALATVNLGGHRSPVAVACRLPGGGAVVDGHGKQIAALADTAPAIPLVMVAADRDARGAPGFLAAEDAGGFTLRAAFGDMALAGLAADGRVRWWRDVGTGRPQEMRERMCRADLDGDGAAEWVVAMPDGTIRVYDDNGGELARQPIGERITALTAMGPLRPGGRARLWVGLDGAVVVLEWRHW